jgi:hypothetical protein
MRIPDEYAKNMRGLSEKYAAIARGEDITKFAIKSKIKEEQLVSTFQDDMSTFAKIIARIRSSAAGMDSAQAKAVDLLLWQLQPFLHTVDRIIAAGVKMSPAGWSLPLIRLVKGHFKGGEYTGAFAKGDDFNPKGLENLQRDMGYIMAGLPFTLAAASAYDKGNMVGELSKDPDVRQAQKDAGMKPYSFKLGGRYHDMRFLPEPVSTSMQFTVASLDALKQAKEDSLGALGTAGQVVLKNASVMINKPYMGGMNSFFGSLAARNNQDIEESPVARKLASPWVPSIVKDIGVTKDTVLGRPRKVSDNAFQDLQRRMGATGGMVDELTTFGEPFTHPMSGQDRTNDPKYKLLMEVPPPVLDKKLGGYDLTQQEYHEIKKELGKKYLRLYEKLGNNPAFMELTKGQKTVRIQEELAAIREDVMYRYDREMVRRDPAYADPYTRTVRELKKPSQDYDKTTFPYLGD